MLVFATAQIAISWYDLDIKNVSGVGIEFSKPNDLISFVLTMGLLFLVPSFWIYALDDLANIEHPEKNKVLIQAFEEARKLSITKIRDLIPNADLKNEENELIYRMLDEGGKASRVKHTIYGMRRTKTGSVRVSWQKKLDALFDDLFDEAGELDRQLSKSAISGITSFRTYGVDTIIPGLYGTLALVLSFFS